MSKEFHVFTHKDSSFEQAFIFEVERHETDKLIEFKDLYMVTSTVHGELRTRIQFENMIQSIIHSEGGNIDDSSVSVIVDMFSDLIPKEKRDEINTDLADKEIKNIDVDQLIKASEYAVIIERAENETKQDKGTTQ